MLEKTDRCRQEELSQAIDNLNAGKRLKSGFDPETKELLATATLLKKAGIPSEGQLLAIERVVNEIARETERKRKRANRFWFYSGSAGVVAAALLVFALNIFTWPFGRPDIAGVPAPNGAPVMEAPVLPPGPIAKFSVSEVQPDKTADPEQPVQNEAQVRPNKRADDAPEATSKLSPDQAGPQPVRAPQGLALIGEKVAGSASETPAAAKEPPKSVAMLRLPGRTADSVTVEKQSGTIRQVYGKGTPEEVIITQAPEKPQMSMASLRAAIPENKVINLEDSPEKSAADGGQAKDAKAADKGGSQKRNRVTVTIDGKKVTVEGNQPEEDLKKIAASLEPGEQ